MNKKGKTVSRQPAGADENQHPNEARRMKAIEDVHNTTAIDFRDYLELFNPRAQSLADVVPLLTPPDRSRARPEVHIFGKAVIATGITNPENDDVVAENALIELLKRTIVALFAEFYFMQSGYFHSEHQGILQLLARKEANYVRLLTPEVRAKIKFNRDKDRFEYRGKELLRTELCNEYFQKVRENLKRAKVVCTKVLDAYEVYDNNVHEIRRAARRMEKTLEVILSPEHVRFSRATTSLGNAFLVSEKLIFKRTKREFVWGFENPNTYKSLQPDGATVFLEWYRTTTTHSEKATALSPPAMVPARRRKPVVLDGDEDDDDEEGKGEGERAAPSQALAASGLLSLSGGGRSGAQSSTEQPTSHQTSSRPDVTLLNATDENALDEHMTDFVVREINDGMLPESNFRFETVYNSPRDIRLAAPDNNRFCIAEQRLDNLINAGDSAAIVEGPLSQQLQSQALITATRQQPPSPPAVLSPRSAREQKGDDQPLKSGYDDEDVEEMEASMALVPIPVLQSAEYLESLYDFQLPPPGQNIAFLCDKVPEPPTPQESFAMMVQYCERACEALQQIALFEHDLLADAQLIAQYAWYILVKTPGLWKSVNKVLNNIGKFIYIMTAQQLPNPAESFSLPSTYRELEKIVDDRFMRKKGLRESVRKGIQRKCRWMLVQIATIIIRFINERTDPTNAPHMNFENAVYFLEAGIDCAQRDRWFPEDENEIAARRLIVGASAQGSVVSAITLGEETPAKRRKCSNSPPASGRRSFPGDTSMGPNDYSARQKKPRRSSLETSPAKKADASKSEEEAAQEKSSGEESEEEEIPPKGSARNAATIAAEGEGEKLPVGIEGANAAAGCPAEKVGDVAGAAIIVDPEDLRVEAQRLRQHCGDLMGSITTIISNLSGKTTDDQGAQQTAPSSSSAQPAADAPQNEEEQKAMPLGRQELANIAEQLKATMDEMHNLHAKVTAYMRSLPDHV